MTSPCYARIVNDRIRFFPWRRVELPEESAQEASRAELREVLRKHVVHASERAAERAMREDN